LNDDFHRSCSGIARGQYGGEIRIVNENHRGDMGAPAHGVREEQTALTLALSTAVGFCTVLQK
jgi:hypothetical protein